MSDRTEYVRKSLNAANGEGDAHVHIISEFEAHACKLEVRVAENPYRSD
jgi:hypothetical protein